MNIFFSPSLLLKAIYVPADDLTDPAPATTFAHLDATTVLSRSIAELGIYPAVDPLDSKSRILDPRVVGDVHYSVATGVQQILQNYKSLQDIIAILGMDELSEEDKVRGKKNLFFFVYCCLFSRLGNGLYLLNFIILFSKSFFFI